MRTTFIAIMLTGLLGANTVLAADDTAVSQRVEEIKNEFNLNDQQAKRIAGILSRAGMSKDEKRAKRMQKRMERRLARMKEHLELTDDQATQIQTIMQQQQEQRQALREQGKTNIIAVLTPEQAAKFEEMRANRKGRKGHRGRHGKRGGRHGGMCNK